MLKERKTLLVVVMGVLLKCNRHTLTDACFIVNSSPSALFGSGLMRPMRSVFCFAASQA